MPPEGFISRPKTGRTKQLDLAWAHCALRLEPALTPAPSPVPSHAPRAALSPLAPCVCVADERELELKHAREEPLANLAEPPPPDPPPRRRAAEPPSRRATAARPAAACAATELKGAGGRTADLSSSSS